MFYKHHSSSLMNYVSSVIELELVGLDLVSVAE